MRGARVLEAGCGVGLPGALALQLGCAELVLQVGLGLGSGLGLGLD